MSKGYVNTEVGYVEVDVNIEVGYVEVDVGSVKLQLSDIIQQINDTLPIERLVKIIQENEKKQALQEIESEFGINTNWERY